MSAKYYVTPTDYGLQCIAEAHNNVDILLKQLVLGDANGIPFDPRTLVHLTALQNQKVAVNISKITTQANGTVRVEATVGSDIGGFNIHEIGLTDITGKLVYIGNWHGGYKSEIADGAGGELSFYIDIKAEQGSNVLINVLNPIYATEKWVTDNFIKKEEFNTYLTTLAESIWHVHSKHITDDINWNPSVSLKPFFGKDTSWFLWPYVPIGIDNVSTVGENILLSNPNDNLTVGKTTRIWQRLPDGAVGPTYKLSSTVSVADEGQTVEITLTTTDLAKDSKVAWNMSGIQAEDITPNNLTGNFQIDAQGKAKHTFKLNLDQVTEGEETLTFALTHLPTEKLVIPVKDTSLYPSNSQTYYEGNHNITVQPLQTLIIDLFGAGGGGGGLKAGEASDPKPDGTDGGDTTLNYLNETFKAGGGKKGEGAISYLNNVTLAQSGEGGKTQTVVMPNYFTVITSKDGKSGALNGSSGGEGLDSTLGKLNFGGDGKADPNDMTNHKGGGGGGSGANVKVEFKNTTNNIVTLNLTVGAKGTAIEDGQDGGIGFALVQYL